MSERRIELQHLLESVLGSGNVYFQPPASVKMSYPAIVYSLSTIRGTKANNQTYVRNTSYTVTLIDKDPDSTLSNRLLELPLCAFDRSYVSDNLNHFVYTIYY